MYFKQKEHQIKMFSADTDFEYPATIKIEDGVRKNHKFIGARWYAYLERHKPRKGDLIIFYVEDEFRLYVKLISKR
jgi:hypothetical protein